MYVFDFFFLLVGSKRSSSSNGSPSPVPTQDPGLCLSSATPTSRSSPGTATDAASLPSGVLVMQLVQVLVLLCQVGVSLVLLVLLVDREKEEILQMPSLLKVMILQSKMEMEMEMETEMNEVERGRRGARLVCGSTTPRRSWSLRITGRHVFRGGLTANSQNANSGVDVRAIMEQQGSGLI